MLGWGGVGGFALITRGKAGRKNSESLSNGPGQTPPSDWSSVSLGVIGQRFAKKAKTIAPTFAAKKSWNKRGREEEREKKTIGLEAQALRSLAATSCCAATIRSAFKAQANGGLAGKRPSTEEEGRQSRAGGWSFSAPARPQAVQLFQPDFPPVSPLALRLIGPKR